MTGTCKLCREIVFGAPVAVVGPDRPKAEFMAFAEAMRQHVYSQHQAQVQVYGALVGMAVAVLSTLFADCALDEFKTAQDECREFVAANIREAQVVIQAGTAVANPLVGSIS